MIPLRLRLHNFMAYREMDPPLDFEGIHVACLAGPNGAGKSALLDAMTWALWGQARARSDDDLVSLGQFEMEVEFEFALGDEHYRILRKRTRPGVRKTGQSLLELQVAELAGDAPVFRPLTENTLRETQRKIEVLLHLDYQTFINTALLLQGRADEFTLKAPGDRKRVLGEVLGLSRYDAYEGRAKDEARRREAAITALGGEIAALEGEAAELQDLEIESRALETLRLESTQAVARQELLVKALEAAMRSFVEKRKRFDEAAARTGQIEGDLAGAAERESALSRRLSEFRRILDRTSAIEAAAAQYRELEARDRQMNGALQQLLRLRQELSAVERRLDEARAKLQTQERDLQQEINHLSELTGAQPVLERQARQAEAGLAGLALEQPGVELLRAQIDGMAQQMGALRHQNETILQQGKELRSKVEQLGKPGATGTCPLCGTELGPDGHDRIMQEYRMELERQRERYRTNERRLKELQEKSAETASSMKDAEARLGNQRASAQSALQLAAQGLDLARQAAAAAPIAQERLSEVQTRLSAGDYALEDRRRNGELASAIEALGYREVDHASLQHQLAGLAAAAGEAQKLEEARRLEPEDRTELERVLDSKERWLAQLHDERSKIAALQEELAAAPNRSGELTTAQQALDGLQHQVRAADQEIGRVQGQIAASIEAQRRVRARRQEAAALAWERQVYDELALAFGRRGLQAMLIETALPELEEETNRLLSRLTDNGLSIRLLTQRQGRAGNLIETLDIIIADESGGSRPYELYSGGEAFRINFALRVALSRLLARRSGAPLQTLIIDEGFGTQDAAGREKLVDAIGAIADDFQRVLVITHIDELKDTFPVRIEVSKTASGSQARVTRM